MVPGHPESPARVSAINDRLAGDGLLDILVHEQPQAATEQQLARVHDAAHIGRIFEFAPESGLVELDADTTMNPHSLDAALVAAGAAVTATDLVLSGAADNAFCNVRPPGHHAERDRAMGFCFFNSVAVAAAHALEHHGLDRVAVLDFDVHHGNGTEDIFRDEPRALMCSTYQYPLYPYTNTPSVAGHQINVPLAPGSTGETFRLAVIEHWLPALDAFRPQMIFVSAGFDAHRADPLAQLALVEADYAWVTERILEAADTWCDGRVVSTLEGGYDLGALARSAAEHVRVLTGD